MNGKDLATEICPPTLCSGGCVCVFLCVPNTLGYVVAIVTLLFTFDLQDSVFAYNN